MSDQHTETTTSTAALVTVVSMCPHPEAIGKRWGDPISPDRQVELQDYLDRWKAGSDPGSRLGPFARHITLSGADVYWLAEQSGYDGNDLLTNLHLEGADLGRAHLEGATLSGAHLERTDLHHTYLNGANLNHAHMDHAGLYWAQLENTILYEAHLEVAAFGHANLKNADLRRAHLEGAFLSEVQAQGATFFEAELEHATFWQANLEKASFHVSQMKDVNFSEAHLEGTDLSEADLNGANFTAAWFDKASSLKKAILTGVSLDQVSFDDTNLAVVDWSHVTTLGDERTARTSTQANGAPKNQTTRLDEYKAAVRAYSTLAISLRKQGMTEDADRFAYRALLVQRTILRRQFPRTIGAYLFSHILDALTGHGYRPWRILVAYVAVIVGFALVPLVGDVFTGHAVGLQDGLNALVASLQAFHERNFGYIFNPHGVATFLEAICGLMIESVFIAMLVQLLGKGSGG